LISMLVLAFNFAIAQSPVGNGGKQINFGTGFSSYGIPLYFGMDFGVHDDITVGFNLSYRSYRERWAGNRYGNSVIGIFGNANYHFNTILEIPREWDVYAGVSLGYYIWSVASGYGGSAASGLGLDGQIGARYYFNDRWGINLEFGGGTVSSGGRIGLSRLL
jgi:outer membrane immunogenic protein